MNPKFKNKAKNYLIGFGLMLLAAALVALTVMSLLFSNTQVTETFGAVIGWICFAISVAAITRKTFLKNVSFEKLKAFPRKTVTRLQNRRALKKRYAAYLIRKYKREHRPFCETHFGEEVRRGVS